MAAARVLHFGRDGHQRIQVLRGAGYKVREIVSLDELHRCLQRDAATLLVAVAEGTRETTEQAAALVRRHSGAPMILFRRSDTPLNLNKYDRVYAASVPSAHWLFDTAVLIEQSQRLRAEAKRLMASHRQLAHNPGVM